MQGARLHGWQPQSTQGASPSYLNLQFSGPVTSSLTQSPVTSGHFYPYGNYPRAPLQSASPGDPHLSEHVAPSVTHPPVIPGHFYPYGNHLRAPLQAPQPQSARPGDPHLSGPMSSVMHPSVIPEFLSPRGILSSPPSGTQRGSPEVQH